MNAKCLKDTGIRKIGLQFRIFLIFICIMGIAAGCSLENPMTVNLNETTKQVSITSAIVGDTYPIYISLPPDYYSNTGKSYDVIYLLDADYYFTTTKNLIYIHVNNNEMDPVIIVGIGNTKQRIRDYTPTNVSDPSQLASSGGGPKFAEFIKTEVIPYIDSNYRTIANPDNRCLAGHSLGGLFAYYTLFFYNDTFHKLIAASASLFWDKGITFQYEADYAASHTSLPVTFYASICTGDYYDNVYHTEMMNRLQSRNYSGFTVLTDTFEGTNHSISWENAFDKGIPKLFHK